MSAGSDSERMCAGSAGTGGESVTGTGCAETPAEGRMTGALCPEGGGYTPGAVWGTTNYTALTH